MLVNTYYRPTILHISSHFIITVTFSHFKYAQTETVFKHNSMFSFVGKRDIVRPLALGLRIHDGAQHGVRWDMAAHVGSSESSESCLLIVWHDKISPCVTLPGIRNSIWTPNPFVQCWGEDAVWVLQQEAWTRSLNTFSWVPAFTT